MAWYCGLESMLKRDVPLAERTTFRIGGPASFFLEPPDERAFGRAYAAAKASGLPVRVLGGGSNLLVANEGVAGIVLATARLCDSAPVVARNRLRARAGTPLATVVDWAAQAGLRGLGCLAGIPGTVGGAVWMNAGGRNGCVGECVDAVWCAGEDGSIFMQRGRDVGWGYRSTDISHPIVAVEFVLESDQPGRLRDEVAEALKAKRRTQPVALPSAGCFFKNPRNDSAGRLIERAGLKGLRVGAARVSQTHANFIVNMGGATAGDVRLLCRRIRDCVCELFGVELETEVHLWLGRATSRHDAVRRPARSAGWRTGGPAGE